MGQVSFQQPSYQFMGIGYVVSVLRLLVHTLTLQIDVID